MGISLDVSNSWKSYKSADIKSNVSSLINDVKEDLSNGINNAKQSWNNASTMVVDLSQKVEEKFDANWDTVKSSFSSAASTLGEQVNNLKTGAQNLRESFNSALNNAKKKTDEFTNNLETKLISASEWVADKENWKKVGATITVGVTSVLTGIADLGEKLVDGVTWCGAKIVEGISFVVAKIQEKTGHEEAAKKTMDWRENMKTDVANWIATDYVQDFNKYIYEETKLGQVINADSWLKYDSKVAQGISSVTEKVAEFAAATALTIATGGAAAPAAFAIVFGTGFLAGVGGSAEKNYAAAKADGKEVSIDDKNLNIFIDGVGTGFSWYAQGKLGQGIVNAAKAISKVGAKTFGSTMLNGFKETLSSLKGKSAKEVMSTIFTKSNLKSQLFSADNLSDSGGVVADNVASWINGDEEFNLKSILGSGAELLGVSLMNIITGGIVDNVGKIDDVAKNMDDNIKFSDDDISCLMGNGYDFSSNWRKRDLISWAHDNFDNIFGSEQIDDIMRDVTKVSEDYWPELLSQRGLSNSILGFVDPSNKLYLPESASIHTAKHEFFHRISEQSALMNGFKYTDAAGNLRKVTGIREFFDDGFDSNWANETLTDFLASKYDDGLIYSSMYDAKNVKLWDRIDEVVTKIKGEGNNFLRDSYIMNDTQAFRNFFSEHCYEGAFDDFIKNIQFWYTSESSEILEGIVSTMEKNVFGNGNKLKSIFKSIFGGK